MDIKIYENEKIKEKLFFKELDSGLKVYFMPKEGYTKQYAIFSTNYGSIDNIFTPIREDETIEVPEGIAHFLEHKLFEEPEENIFDKFSKLGANVNAYTNFTQTAYLFSSTENFYENLELLVQFVQHPYFTDENVEKEKGIIAQEINMYKDNPNWRVFFNCLRAMYTEHPVRIDIAGTVESIQDINKELLYKCYDTFYNPNNMVLFIAGDLSFDEILKIVEKTERKDYTKIEEVNRVFKEEPKGVKESFIEENMMTSTPLFYIGFKDEDVNLPGEERVKKDLVTNFILDMIFGSSSVFYNELYEEGIIDSSFGAYFTGKKSYGHSLVGGESKKPKEVYNRVMDLFEKDPQSILIEDDFNRIKRKNIGGFLMAFNSVESIANNFMDLYFEEVLLIDYLEILESIEYKDLIERFNKHFVKENVVLSIVNPLS
ncbi:pitrilysin family protein [Tissierella sp. MB52-C2]|uniref:EF-P 5-aminopentanol modification-associated protein YfmH n=1 Tax=Tissierella sp. MB52-C2 TaxID=3070999 RepID=UPI00280C210C|nr:pitrilysin family protein [Tissierella sp. MB52-C2]WMM23366.1 pitrilysin family protein [Tissierella sp. MB52-C2]